MLLKKGFLGEKSPKKGYFSYISLADIPKTANAKKTGTKPITMAVIPVKLFASMTPWVIGMPPATITIMATIVPIIVLLSGMVHLLVFYGG